MKLVKQGVTAIPLVVCYGVVCLGSLLVAAGNFCGQWLFDIGEWE